MKFPNKVFRLMLIFIAKRNFNQNERSCSSNKLGGIIYKSSKLIVELMKLFTVLLMNRNG